MPPTLFANITPAIAEARGEIFGLVLAVGKFATVYEAIGVAILSGYGLFASIHSKDFAQAMRVARKLYMGGALLHNYSRAFLGTSFGGVKASGRDKEHWIWTQRVGQDQKHSQPQRSQVQSIIEGCIRYSFRWQKSRVALRTIIASRRAPHERPADPPV